MEKLELLDSSIGVLCCIDIMVCNLFVAYLDNVVVIAIAISLAICCNGLVSDSCLFGVVSLSKILKSCHIPGLMLVIRVIKLVLE